MQAKEVMSNHPEFLPPSATLKQAASQMKVSDYGFIPIGENDRLIGTVTDRDLVIGAIANGLDPNKKTVQEVMHKGVFYCYETDELKDVIKIMEENQVRRLVVLSSEKRMVGILSLGDIATKCHDATLCAELTEAVSEELH